MEFRSVGFWGEGKTGVPKERPLGAEKRTNNKLKPNMMPSPESNQGSHWWGTSALTIMPSLLPNMLSITEFKGCHWSILPMENIVSISWTPFLIHFSITMISFCIRKSNHTVKYLRDNRYKQFFMVCFFKKNNIFSVRSLLLRVMSTT